MRACLSFILVAVVSGFNLHTQPLTSGELLVLSKADETLAVVDPATNKVLGRVPVGKDPHEVIASADGKLAYVSNYGGGAYNTLAVVDLVRRTALPPVDLGPLCGPHGLTAAGGKIWFTAEGAKAVGSYNPATSKIDWVMGTGQNRTHMLFVARDLQSVYTTNISSASVSILVKSSNAGPDSGPPPPPPGGARPPRRPGGVRGPMGPPGGDWTQTVLPAGRGVEGFDVSPDGRELWAANAADGTVSVIDPSSKSVKTTLPADYKGANRLKFTPDGKLVFIAGSGLAILDASSRKNVKRLDLGRCAGIQMQPDATRAYVACTEQNYVAVIDLKTLAVISRIEAGGEPDGLAWAANNQ